MTEGRRCYVVVGGVDPSVSYFSAYEEHHEYFRFPVHDPGNAGSAALEAAALSQGFVARARLSTTPCALFVLAAAWEWMMRAQLRAAPLRAERRIAAARVHRRRGSGSASPHSRRTAGPAQPAPQAGRRAAPRRHPRGPEMVEARLAPARGTAVPRIRGPVRPVPGYH